MCPVDFTNFNQKFGETPCTLNVYLGYSYPFIRQWRKTIATNRCNPLWENPGLRDQFGGGVEV